jgi:putative transposase
MFLYGIGSKIQFSKISNKRRQILEYIINDTIIKVGSEYIWLWIAIEPRRKEILGISIFIERNTFVDDRFISNLIKIYDNRPVSTGGGTWYHQDCRFLKLQHRLHSPYKKSIIERTIQYIKDRTEYFDDIFHDIEEKRDVN